MLHRFEVGGRAILHVSGPSDLERAVLARMDPLQPGPASDGPADLRLRPAEPGELRPAVDIQRAAGDGIVTESDGEQLYLVAGDARCAVPDVLSEGPAVFAFEPGFPITGSSWRFVRTALQLAMLDREAVAVHACCTELDGGAVLVAGWSETGKTEVALALAEAGGRFVSDKWTVVGTDRTAAAFPIEVGVRSWVLPYLPRMRAALPRAARIQLGIAGRAATPARRLRERLQGPRTGPVAEGVERVVMLGERSPVAASTVRAVYGLGDDPGRALPLRAVVLLTTVDEAVDAPASVELEWATRRLALSGAYERRPYFGLTERARFAAPGRPRADLADEVIRREVELLGSALGDAELLQVRVPFPTDPRPVAEAIVRCLG